MAEEFKFLAIKNWEKYQPKDSKNLPWIRDYKDKDWDKDFSQLTVMQRYMLDAICRLRGRHGRQLPNDPQWIIRAIAVLPRERHNASSAIRELIKKTFLVETNDRDTSAIQQRNSSHTTEIQQRNSSHTTEIQQRNSSHTTEIQQPDNSGHLGQQNEQVTPLGEYRKGKEREGEGSISQQKPLTSDLAKPPKDSDVKIEQIAQAHPKFRKPVETEREIVMQLDRLGDRMGVDSAMKYLLERTLRYAQAYKRWEPERQRFSPESPRWFNAGCFQEDPLTWEAEEKGNGKVEQAGTSAAVAAGVDKFLRRKAAMGAQDVSRAATPEPGNTS